MNIIVVLVILIINILSVNAEPIQSEEIYITTTLYSCICYLILAGIAKLCIIIYKTHLKKFFKTYRLKNSEKKNITSINSSIDSIPTLLTKYKNIKDIEKVVPPNLEIYISPEQWSEQISYLNLFDQHRNKFFSFHPLAFPLVSALVKYYQYYKMNSDWDNYLLEKAKKDEDTYKMNQMSSEFKKNNEEKVLKYICIILIIEEIVCFFLYYWFSKFMVKKNHKSFTMQFSQMNDSLKNKNIPLVWVLDWKPPKYDLFGFSEKCIIELHYVDQDDFLVID